MTAYTTGDAVLEHLEAQLGKIKLVDALSDRDCLTPFHLSPEEMNEQITLEGRFTVGMVDGPYRKSSCSEEMTVEVSSQWQTRKESRRRMLDALPRMWDAIRGLGTTFEAAGSPGLKAPAVQQPYEYDYTSVLGFVTVTMTVVLEYHVAARET